MKRLVFVILAIMAIVDTFAQASGGQIRRPVKKQQSNAVNRGGKIISSSQQRQRRESEITEEKIMPNSIQNLINNMVYIEGGTYYMGATYEQWSDALDDEKPSHRVKLKSYYIGRYEVTQEEWETVMGRNPSSEKGNKRPVTDVSWQDCQEFIRKLNSITDGHFRLPTEAEWEYAARGGLRSNEYKYSGNNNIDDVAWYDSNSYGTIHIVGMKSPNELGIYDMSGNVWEWCQDWFGRYLNIDQTNPSGSSYGDYRVRRGGSINDSERILRITKRGCSAPSGKSKYLGLRLAY